MKHNLIPPKPSFTHWLISHHNLKVRDFDKAKVPQLDLERLLVHEDKHILRQRKLGWLVFYVRYAFSKRFRMKEEVYAFTRSMEWRYINKQDFPNMPYRYAQFLRNHYNIGRELSVRAEELLERNLIKIRNGEIREVLDLCEEYIIYTRKKC